jgi:regulator of nonsense transcripts 2
LFNSNKDVFKISGSLDSSLKKNTAFIKRLRASLNADNQSALLKDLSSLSLEKYIPEVVAAASEGLQKCKTGSDILAAVEVGSSKFNLTQVVSALHQRFGSAFTSPLTGNILRALAPSSATQLASLTADQRDKEESARLIRQRVFLKVATELWLVNVLRNVSDANSTPVDSVKLASSKSVVKGKKMEAEVDISDLPLTVLKELLGKDKDHFNLPILVAFTKTFSYDVLGVKQINVKRPTDVNIEESKQEVSSQAISLDEPLCSSDVQESFRNIVQKYFASVKAHIIRSHKVCPIQPKLTIAHS